MEREKENVSEADDKRFKIYLLAAIRIRVLSTTLIKKKN